MDITLLAIWLLCFVLVIVVGIAGFFVGKYESGSAPQIHNIRFTQEELHTMFEIARHDDDWDSSLRRLDRGD